MPKYYVVDSTIKQGNKNPVYIFETTDGVVKHLEGMCQRHFKQTRKQYMEHAESVGHSSDEISGRAFYDQMEQYFNMGVIRGDSTPVKTNIFEAKAFLKNKEAHGD
jgi:hypothetical protein